jgi:hypothetical protein
MWCFEYNLIEKGDNQNIDSRGVDAGYEVVHVFTDPFEPKISENGDDKASRGRRMSACPVRV